MTKTKNIKVTGIKKAMSNYNTCDNWRTYGLFYLDIITGDVWCNLYNDCSSWTIYHNDDIICLNPWEYLPDPENKLTMARLKFACECAIKQHSK